MKKDNKETRKKEGRLVICNIHLLAVDHFLMAPSATTSLCAFVFYLVLFFCSVFRIFFSQAKQARHSRQAIKQASKDRQCCQRAKGDRVNRCRQTERERDRETDRQTSRETAIAIAMKQQQSP